MKIRNELMSQKLFLLLDVLLVSSFSGKIKAGQSRGNEDISSRQDNNH